MSKFVRFALIGLLSAIEHMAREILEAGSGA